MEIKSVTDYMNIHTSNNVLLTKDNIGKKNIGQDVLNVSSVIHMNQYNIYSFLFHSQSYFGELFILL
jgi:hypothetical protein